MARVPASAAILLLAVLGTAACSESVGGLSPSPPGSDVPPGSPALTASVDPTASDDLVAALRTFPFQPGAPCDSIAVEHPVSGVLEGDAGDPLEPIWLRQVDGRRISVVWPAGFAARFDPEPRLLNELGAQVARAGEEVQLGQVDGTQAAGTFEDPYVAAGVLFDRCYASGTVDEESEVVVTVVDRVRVRSAPGLGDGSLRLSPLLPAGTALFVLDGPVAAGGYDWLQVAPLAFPELDAPFGWVARAARDGTPWLGPELPECPAAPASVGALVALSPGERLACFSGASISVPARLVPCNCDIDGGLLEPAWLGTGDGQPLLLVEPTASSPPDAFEDWLILHLDPDAEAPEPLPVGSVVLATGTFDHPAAAECRVSTIDRPSPEPSPLCRFEFAVSALEVVRG